MYLLAGLVKIMDHRKQTDRKSVVKKPAVNPSDDEKPQCSGKCLFCLDGLMQFQC